jgi:alpha-1,2-mannosyltransferase
MDAADPATVESTDTVKVPGGAGSPLKPDARDRGARWRACFAVLGVGAAAQRIFAIAHRQVGWVHHVGATYDEAIYLGGSWSLWAGTAVPYRDFVWVFPPGHLLLLAPVTLLGRLIGAGPGASLTLARVLSALAGGVSTYLVGRVGARWLGVAGGIAAALLYATSPVAWPTEATALQEPLVNVLILAAAWWWLADPPADTRRQVGSVLLVGLAISVKLIAVVLLLPFLAVGPFRRPLRDRAVLALVAGSPLAVTGLVAVAGAGWHAPVDQALLSQLTRPPAGAILPRVDSMVPLLRGQTPWLRSLADLDPRFAVAATALLAGGAILAGRRAGRFWGVTVLATGAALLLSPSYFTHYGTLLVPGVALLLAWGLAALARRVFRRGSRIRSTIVVGVAMLVAGLQLVAAAEALPGPEHPLPSAMTAAITAAGCVFSVRPQSLFDLNRLPSPGPDGRVLLDVYGSALAGRLHQRTDDHAFGAYRVPSVQRQLVRSARSCEFDLLTDRRCATGRRDLTAATERAIRRGTALVAEQGCVLLLRQRDVG